MIKDPGLVPLHLVLTAVVGNDSSLLTCLSLKASVAGLLKCAYLCLFGLTAFTTYQWYLGFDSKGAASPKCQFVF